MSLTSRPNSWVSRVGATATQLTYALRLNPAPLTVSISGRDPILASLEFVITNPTSAPIQLTSIIFTLRVGSTGDSITSSVANAGALTSDQTNWQVQIPGPVSSGPADFVVLPATGTGSLPAQSSLVVELYNLPTVENPGNSTVSVKEVLAGGLTGFTSFLVSTFPTGFYFNGLSATVESGSTLVPAAQVATGASVTLVWNSSVVDVNSFTIYYSTGANGQQKATPSDTGIWTSPPLASDTVFTIVVTVSVEGGSPLSAALSTSVAVQNPTLIAASITASAATVNGALTVTGPVQANAVTATGLTVNGATTTADLTASGTLSVPAQSNLGTLVVNSTTTIGSSLRINGTADSTPSLSLGGSGVFNVDAINVVGGRFTVQNSGSVGINRPSPGATLDVNGNLAVSGGANINGTVSMCNAGDGSLGRMGIGGFVSGNVMLYVKNTLSNAYGVLIDSQQSKGQQWALAVYGSCINSSGSWSRISDLALKNRVQPYEDGLEKVLKINPIRFHYREEMGLSAEQEHVGVAAQDLQQIAPYMVSKAPIKSDTAEEYLTIDDGAMTYMLINAVKELHAEVEALKAELKTLKRD
jgi:Chaperone of endosialidase